MAFSVGDLKSFALVAAEIASGEPIARSALPAVTPWIDFVGGPGTIRTISFARVANGKTPAGFFAGKIVVVGGVAPSLQDLHTTSVSGSRQMAGPEIVANAISTALRGFPLRQVPALVDLILIVALALVVPLVNTRLRLPWALVAGLAAAAVYLVAAQVAFDAGRIVAVAYPLLALLLSAVATLGVRYAMVSRPAREQVSGTEELAPGMVIDGYRIERSAGRGGGGTVYLATEDNLRRKVAVKVLHPDLAKDAAIRTRFLEESQRAAALDHPNVVEIIRSGERDGVVYVAMKWVRSSLLALLERDGTLTVDRSLSIVGQVADALDAAHAIGLVHRDVTPSNILLEPSRDHLGADRVYLADFGLTFHKGQTAESGLVGKPEYVAPEQLEGGAVDGRADQYSLACVLYECLAGEPPFTGRSEVAVMGARLAQAPPRISGRRPDLPEALDDVLARALSRSPAGRFPTCAGFVAAVRSAWLGPETIATGPRPGGTQDVQTGQAQ